MLIPVAPTTADMAMRLLTVVELGGGLVADMDGRQLLDHVEPEEADRGRDHHLVEGGGQVDGFGDQVEEGGTDPDPRPEGDDDPDEPDGPEREDPTQEGRDECRARDGDRCQRHGHSTGRGWAMAGDPSSLSSAIVEMRSAG
jgi:hypothetical protein